MDNILALSRDLRNRTYVHGGYHAFNISDPKPRSIHKATVRDRVLHHAIYRKLYPFFDRAFIADSFSCRVGKGTHKAIGRFHTFTSRVSHNNTKTCWILKCDIKKFFANIDHAILLDILEKRISDTDLIWLLKNVIESFHSSPKSGIGLPLGNLTSQLLVNIYMNEFDQFMKHTLKTKYYIRYADDFVIFSESKALLIDVLKQIKEFLSIHLHLALHPTKVSVETLASGVDFLGWVHFPHHRVLRTATKRRMLKRVRTNPTRETFESYRGLLRHGSTNGLQKKLTEQYLLAHD